MPVVNTYDGNVPTYDADEDTWGFELNTALGAQIKPTLDAFATAINANETLSNAALPKAGGTMTGNISLADVAPTNALAVGFRGAPVVSIDAVRTFGLTDSGKMIRLTGTTARTWTIPPVASVGFPIGTIIVLRNTSTASITIARGASVELRIVGLTADSNKTIASQGLATLTMEESNVWVLSGVGIS